jgi:heme-degrading monooxygenase HmoA
MIKHVVMWRLADPAEGASKAANAARIKSLLEACSGRIPGLRSLEVGIDAGLDPQAWDVVLVTEFDDRASFDAYQVHPVHEEAKAFIGKVRKDRSAVDYMV